MEISWNILSGTRITFSLGYNFANTYFLSSSTQNENFPCSSKTNVEYLKRLVAWLAQGYGFGPLSTSNGGAVNLAFDLKIPGADFLTNEEELLCSIPYVHSAKQRKSRVIFLVLPRNSSVSKKVRFVVFLLFPLPPMLLKLLQMLRISSYVDEAR